MAKATQPPAPSQTEPTDKIRFIESDVCHGSAWFAGAVMTVNDDNRADAEMAVKRKTAVWVKDANATGNAANA